MIWRRTAEINVLSSGTHMSASFTSQQCSPILDLCPYTQFGVKSWSCYLTRLINKTLSVVLCWWEVWCNYVLNALPAPRSHEWIHHIMCKGVLGVLEQKIWDDVYRLDRLQGSVSAQKIKLGQMGCFFFLHGWYATSCPSCDFMWVILWDASSFLKKTSVNLWSSSSLTHLKSYLHLSLLRTVKIYLGFLTVKLICFEEIISFKEKNYSKWS